MVGEGTSNFVFTTVMSTTMVVMATPANEQALPEQYHIFLDSLKQIG
jgi:hypothetical protein